MKRKSTANTILNIFLSFLLAFILVIDTIAAIAYAAPLNPEYLKGRVDQTELPETAREYITRQFSDHGISSGFDEDFFLMLTDEETIRSDMKGEIDWLFGGEERFNRTEFKKKLNNRFLEQIESMGEDITPDVKENVYEMCDTFGTIYKTTITFPFAKTLRASYQILYPNRWLIAFGLGLFTLLLIGFIYWLNHRKGRTREYILYAAVTAAVVPAIPGILLAVQKGFSGLLIPNPVTKQIFSEMGTAFVQGLLLAAAFFTGICILLVLTAPGKKDILNPSLPAAAQKQIDLFDDSSDEVRPRM